MAKAKNSSNKISQAPPPPADTPRRRYVPPANIEPAHPSAETVQEAEFSLPEAERHCREAIGKGWNIKTVDQARWTGETERWSKVWWPELEAALAKCKEAGMHADELKERRTLLETDWGIVCKYRDGLAMAPGTAKAASVDHFKTGAAGRPKATHLVLAEAERRIASGEFTPKPGKRAEFSRDLADWWKKEGDRLGGPTLTAGGIGEALRVTGLWNRAVSDAKN
jgi:hypothetical protein